MALPLQLQFFLVFAAGWVNRNQQAVIDYLLAENRVLREQLGPKRPSFTLAQRRRLARAGKALGRKLLGEYAQLATPDTILRLCRARHRRTYPELTAIPSAIGCAASRADSLAMGSG